MAGLILTKLGTIHPWMKGIKDCLTEEPLNSHKVNNGFILLLINRII